MLSLLRIRVLAIGVSLVIGCGHRPVPSHDVPMSATVPKSEMESHVETELLPKQADPVEEFLRQDGFCRDVLNRKSLTDFLAESLEATKDKEQSRPDISYAVYRESMFMYEFLDEKLFAIRYVMPRSRDSAEKSIAPYCAALGEPNNTQMPVDFRAAKATQFQSWDLPDHNLRINFADLPAKIGEADLDLFGQFINLEAAQEFLDRRSSAATTAPSANDSLSSRSHAIARREIAEHMADPQWGAVASEINRLCAGQLSDEEIHLQILKTIQLARSGKFTPAFTAKALKNAELSAIRLGLASVTAVRTCQQSLAFAAAADNSIP